MVYFGWWYRNYQSSRPPRPVPMSNLVAEFVRGLGHSILYNCGYNSPVPSQFGLLASLLLDFIKALRRIPFNIALISERRLLGVPQGRVHTALTD